MLLSIISFLICYLFRASCLHYCKKNLFQRCNLATRSALCAINENKYLDDKGLQDFLKGDGANVPWKGTTEILKRRKQVPSSEYDPQTVVRKCLQALQTNDDPQLDHGSCVLLAFKSPFGMLSQGGLDPAGYGRFLRSTNYQILLDNSDFDLVDDPLPLQDSLSVRQRVLVKGWNLNGNVEKKIFDFYLSKFGENWLVDVILAVEA